MKKFFIYFGFVLGSVFFVLGLATLFGFLVPKSPFEQFNILKWVLGIVLLLYGLYRIIMSYFKLKDKENENEKGIL